MWGKESSKMISAKFILLHTVSHMLIKEVSSFCGYNIASLQERIYCAEKSKDGIDTQGILIYTAGGDSEGTLGGLVRQGRYDLFPNLFKRAVESAMYCSNDPVCSLSSGQGRDVLNLSACHSCALVPETSCEESNVFLDRGMLVGDFDDRKYGFFSEALYSENKWNVAQHEIKSDDVENRSTELVFGDYGKALESLPYKEIWTDMMVDCEETEKANIHKIIENLESLSFDEKPYENSEFSSADGVLFDKKKSVLLRFPVFKRCDEYVIPDTVKRIEDSAFEWCRRIKSVVIPKGVTYIGESAFALCDELAQIKVPFTATEIGSAAFVTEDNCNKAQRRDVTLSFYKNDSIVPLKLKRNWNVFTEEKKLSQFIGDPKHHEKHLSEFKDADYKLAAAMIMYFLFDEKGFAEKTVRANMETVIDLAVEANSKGVIRKLLSDDMLTEDQRKKVLAEGKRQ